MVFASIRENASTAIFLRARAEIKNLVCEQRAVQRVQLASREHFLYFPLADPYGNPFLKKKKKKKKKKQKWFKKTMLYSSLSSKRSVETLF